MKYIIIGGIKVYQKTLSPWSNWLLKKVAKGQYTQKCGMTPTCSNYAREAIERHGCVAGVTLGTWRIMRCGPWCKQTHDPVPVNLSSSWPKL